MDAFLKRGVIKMEKDYNEKNKKIRGYNGSKGTDSEGMSQIIEYLKTGDRKNIYNLMKIGGIIQNFSASLNMTSTQMRKFYSMYKKLEDLASKEGNEKQVITKLSCMSPLLEYAKERKVATPGFVDFMDKAIEIIVKDESTVQEKYFLFLRIFESIIAYSKQQKR